MRYPAMYLVATMLVLVTHPAAAQVRLAKQTLTEQYDTPPLQRRAGIDIKSVPLERALEELHRTAGVNLLFSPTQIPQAKVTCRCSRNTVEEALRQMLENTTLLYQEVEDDIVIVPVRRVPPRINGFRGLLAASVDHIRPVYNFVPLFTRAADFVAGVVLNARTGQPVAGAQVVVLGSSRGAITDNAGRFRIEQLVGEEVRLRVVMLGFKTITQTVRVAAEDVRVLLEETAIGLDELVVTGTMVPTAVKALPNPVTIIDEEEISSQRPQTMQQVFRRAIPSAVAWDLPTNPAQTTYSVRGTSMLLGGRGQMKVFIDGVPAANNTIAAVDPNSVERVEVIRGPQAAAIYGSDALGGVIQIFTKRGNPNESKPRVNAEAAVGIVQTPYSEFDDVARQSYKASALGGGSGFSYDFGAGYSRIPDWVGPETGQSVPTAHAGLQIERGMFTAALSGRYHMQNFGNAIAPEFMASGYILAAPSQIAITTKYQTIGATFGLAPKTWWTHKLTGGVDHNAQDAVQQRPRLFTPADTMLQASNSNRTRHFIEYSSSINGPLSASATGSLVAGFDYYSLLSTLWSVSSTRRTEGTITSSAPLFISRTVTENTGYFAQGQLTLWDRLSFTAGVRADDNTDFGDSLSAPVSSRFGVSYAPSFRSLTMKMRASWGRAIRAPDPGQKTGQVTGTTVTIPNPILGPEKQEGWDAGVDAFFGRRGSISVTYYDQKADDLIQQLMLSQNGTSFTYQFQNVGQVDNSGFEVEGVLSLGAIEMRAQYGYTRSRIAKLGANYTGDLMVGDHPLAIPEHSGGLTLTAEPRAGTALSGGLTYVGDYTGYDLLPLYSCFARTGPCRPGPGQRNYRTTVDGFVKVNASINQRVTQRLSGFLSMDNLTNTSAREFTLATPVMGRVTMFGVQLQF